MRLKTFSAATMAQAMDLVRSEMGEEAIIVSTQAGLDGRAARVTAALEEAEFEDIIDPFDSLQAEPVEAMDVGEEIALHLAFHGVPPKVVDRLVQAAGPFVAEGTIAALIGALGSVFGFAPLSPTGQDKPLIVVGPPGAGKTIAVAKVATQARRSGARPLVITTDTRRAGGIEQLEAFTRILKIELQATDSPNELAKIVAAAGDRSVLIDTAGTNPFSTVEMERLGELIQSIGAEPVLVLSAGGDAMDAADMAVNFASLGVRRLLAMRLDLSRRLGGLMAAAEAGKLAFSDVSISGDIADGLTPISPVSLARLILPSDTTTETTSHINEAAQ